MMNSPGVEHTNTTHQALRHRESLESALNVCVASDLNHEGHEISKSTETWLGFF